MGLGAVVRAADMLIFFKENSFIKRERPKETKALSFNHTASISLLVYPFELILFIILDYLRQRCLSNGKDQQFSCPSFVFNKFFRN